MSDDESSALGLEATCESHEHSGAPVEPADAATCQQAADIFSALGDPNRFRLLTLLIHGEKCVTEIAEQLGDNLSAVSHRLRLLRTQRIVSFRREGKHVVYFLDDDHIVSLVSNALAHAGEGRLE
ncbi:MAG: metalloregulator ArsR/SmtB family transcription factor [Pirellulales bacterium]